MKNNIKRIFIIILIIINFIIPTTLQAVEIDNNIPEEPIQEPENPNPGENTNPETDPPIETPTNPPVTPEEPQNPEKPVQEPENPQSQIQEPETSTEQPTTYHQETYTYEQKSDNNYLRFLEIKNVDIEPEFDRETMEYYVVVDLSVDELEITANAEDRSATVKILGNTQLEEGENTITIIVTAEDLSQRTYKIIVTKTDNAELVNANLKSLYVKGFEIYPTFSSKIYKYNLTINEKIYSLEILAEAENENATIEIKGNNQLKEGNNTITITVTAEDGITKREYSINTFISSLTVEVKEENKLPALIAMGIGALIALILLIHIIKNKQ